MARQELERRLKELNMSAGEAKEYNALLAEVQAHITQLVDLFESACVFLFLYVVYACFNVDFPLFLLLFV